jgi:hypothetical protein
MWWPSYCMWPSIVHACIGRESVGHIYQLMFELTGELRNTLNNLAPRGLVTTAYGPKNYQLRRRRRRSVQPTRTCVYDRRKKICPVIEKRYIGYFPSCVL